VKVKIAQFEGGATGGVTLGRAYEFIGSAAEVVAELSARSTTGYAGKVSTCSDEERVEIQRAARAAGWVHPAGACR
jgi:hypothetical protein